MTPTKVAHAMSVLGISRAPDGSDEYAKELKSAWRAAATRAHPDRGGSAEKFKVVSEAHDVLREAQERLSKKTGRKKPPPKGGWTSTWGVPPEARTDVDDDIDDDVEQADEEDIEAIVAAVRDLRTRATRSTQRTNVASERVDIFARKLDETRAILDRMLRQLGELAEIIAETQKENERLHADIERLAQGETTPTNPYSTFTDDHS